MVNVFHFSLRFNRNLTHSLNRSFKKETITTEYNNNKCLKIRFKTKKERKNNEERNVIEFEIRQIIKEESR